MSTQAMPQEVQVAIGRLFRMLMSKPSASDVADFHNCREIIMNAAESHGMKNAGPVLSDQFSPWAEGKGP